MKTRFSVAVPLYQEALTKSGYQHKLKYQQPPTPQNTINSRSWKRNITWYNPPFSKNVATNIGQTFLKILDEEFPISHILHKIFNRNTVKISYSCMSNFKPVSVICRLQTADCRLQTKYKMQNRYKLQTEIAVLV
jgi:hypothetical protein